MAKRALKPKSSASFRPSSKTYQQIPTLAFSDWSSVGQVKQTLNELEAGMFRTPALLTEAMGRDDRITGVVETRMNSLNGLPLEFEPADDSQKALTISEDVKKLWPKMFPEPATNSIRRWGLFVGLGVSQLLWNDLGQDQWVPIAEPWNPQYTYWRWDTWSYWLTTQNEGQQELQAGDEGEHNWFLYAPSGLVRGWMDGAVRSLAIPWLIRQWDWRDWARFNEIHGVPIRAGIMPAEAQRPDKERFINELAALGAETVLALEQGAKDGPKFDLKLIEAMSTNYQNFEKLMDQANTAIAVRLLGQNLTTEGGKGSSGGSKALGQVHDRVRGDFLRSDSTTFGTCARDQVLKPFCLFNYGDPKLAPTPKWNTDPPEDKTQNATTLGLLGDAMLKLRQAGAPVDVLQVCRDFGVPLVEGAPAGPLVLPKPPGPGSGKPGEDGKDGKPGEKPDSKPNGATQQQVQQSARALPPHIEAQVFTDEVADQGVEDAKRILKTDLAAVLAAVEKGETYAGIRKHLLDSFRGMDPSKLARLMRVSLTLAQLNGRHSVREELSR